LRAFALWFLSYLDLGICPVRAIRNPIALELTNLDFDTELPRRFTVVEFDASGKPKPLSSTDERKVEPCF
jgi:hypothetical protein